MSDRKVLIYRLGSLGDTVVAVPSLRLIARAFPDAERRVLTNFPVSEKEVSLEDVIGISGLVHGYFRYPIGSRNWRELWSLRQEISRWSPDVFVYLAEPRGKLKTYRDALFFRICGIRVLIGVPYSKDLQELSKLDGEIRFESEAHRLLRCINELGIVNLEDSESWDLCLNEAEELAAGGLLFEEMPLFIAASVGTKVGINDWGENKWSSLLSRVSSRYPELGLVLVGASEERARSDLVADNWNGPKRNLCGLTPPRISAAVLKRSVLFMGHDSGPMHLAAATGVPCIAIFSARNKPGKWFPGGMHHHVIYHKTDCYGCELNQCIKQEKKCIETITVEEVFDAVCQKFEERWVPKFGPSCRVNPSR